MDLTLRFFDILENNISIPLIIDEYDFDSSMILKNNCLIWEYTFFGFSGTVKNWIIESLS